MTVRRSGRRRPAIAAGVAAVAGAGLAIWLSTRAPAHDTAGGFKIATWNLEWLTDRKAGDPALPDDAAPKRDDDIATLAGYAARLDPAVAALEEVDSAALASRIFPPDRYRMLITADQVVQKVALAVRRDIPVERHPDYAALDVSSGARYRLRSGLDVTLTLDGRQLRLLAVHLKSGCWSGPLQGSTKPACRMLSEQLPILQDWIAARRREGMPFLVLGDFNRRLPNGDPLLAGLENAAPMAVATAGHASPCWGGEDFIDQILAGGPARDWMEPGSLRVMVFHETAPAMKERLSDHCPVSIRLQVPRG